MTQTPTLTGQDIGQAHKATRAVLERRLADTGIEFNAWVTLNVLGGNGSTLAENDLVDRAVHGLKADPEVIRDVVNELIEHGLIERTASASGSRVSLTPAGTESFAQVKGIVSEITERLYGGLPADELAVAHRILTAVTARANAELVR